MLALLAAPVAAQTVAVTNARLMTAAPGAEEVSGGTVVIAGGRVVAAGAGVAVPPGARVIDAGGRYVTPGIFAGLTNIGISEVFGGVRETNDGDAGTSDFQASIDVGEAVNPRSVHMGVNRVAGVTRAAVTPETGRSIFAGQGAVVSLRAGLADAVTGRRAFQYVDLSQSGGRTAGGSRPAAYAVFRNALADAAAVVRGAPPSGGREKTSILTRRDAEALAPVVSGRQLLLVHVERAQDIRGVLRLRGQFPALRLVLVGASEGWLVAREIAAARVPVIAQALENLPQSFDSLAATQSNVGRLVAAGVPVALSGYGSGTGEQPRLLPGDAGNLVAIGRVPGATGLTRGQALAAITRVPAEVYGLGAGYGSLAPGRAADVVMWSGDPLEPSSTPVMVMIDGVEQSLVSRQTELRDRYLGLRKEGVPSLRYRR